MQAKCLETSGPTCAICKSTRLPLSFLSKGRKRVLIGRYYRLTTTRTTLSRRDSPPSITLSAIFPPQFAPSCNELNLPVETRLLPRIAPTNRYGNSSFTKFLCREGGGKGDNFYTGDILNLALRRRRRVVIRTITRFQRIGDLDYGCGARI